MSFFELLPNGQFWSSLSSWLAGPGTYSNITGDFTATASAGTNQIVLNAFTSAAFSAGLDSNSFTACTITRRDTLTGNVDTLPTTNVTYAAGTLTLGDMTGTFAATDDVVVSVPGPMKGSPINDGSAASNVAVRTDAGIDGATNVNRLQTMSAGMAFNGTSWDRVRSGIATVAGLATNGVTGLLDTLTVAIYNATPSARTTGNAGPLESTAKGALKTALTDANNVNAADVDVIADAAADGEYALDTDAKMSAFNGTSWDRVRSGVTTLGSALTGFVNQLPWAIYNANPTARIEGQGGPLQAAANGALTTSITDGVAAGSVAVQNPSADGVNTAVNRLQTVASMMGFNGTSWDRLTVASTVADGVAIALTRLRTTAVMMAINGTAIGANSLDALRAGVTSIGSTFTGMLNTLPAAIYNATPTARANGEGGHLQADANGNLLESLGTYIFGEDATNNLMAMMAKPAISTTYSWTRYALLANGGASVTTANVKASAAQLFSIYCHNTSASAAYLQIFNTTGATNTGLALSYLVPAGGALFVDSTQLGANGTNLSTGLTWALSTQEYQYSATATGIATCILHYV